MRTLNRSLPHGDVHGGHGEFPNVKYYQMGPDKVQAYFNNRGECVCVDSKAGPEKYDPKKHDKNLANASDPNKAHASQITTAKAQLGDWSIELSKMDQDIAKLESDLEEAKKRDVNKKDYTSKVSGIQSQLTNTKRERTKLNNKAAVLQDKILKGAFNQEDDETESEEEEG